MKQSLGESIDLSKSIIKKSYFVVFTLGSLVGLLNLGYVILMIFLSYYFLKDDEEKYIFLLGYVASCLGQGFLYTYEQLFLVLSYVVLIMLVRLWHHNFTIIYIIGTLLLCIYNVYLKLDLSTSLSIVILFNATISILFQIPKSDIIKYLCILILIAYIGYFKLSINTYVLLTSLLIVLSSLYFPLKAMIMLILFTNFLITQSIVLLPLLMPLLFLMLGINKYLSGMLFLLTLGIVSPNNLIYGGMIILIYYIFPSSIKVKEIKNDHEFKQNLSLLEKLSNLTANISTYTKDSELPLIMKEVFDNTIDDLISQKKMEDYPRLISEELDGYGYSVVDVSVARDFDMIITIKLLNITKVEIESNILPIISNVLGIKAYLIDYSHANLIHSYHELNIGLHKVLSLKYNYFQIPKIPKACGDMVRVLRYHQNQYFMLSDGMGSGLEAQSESKYALDFLSNLIIVGLSLKRVINIVNDILNLKSVEMFSTLDLLNINVYDGNAYLYKQGSAKTYLIRENEIYTFESNSMPLGIVKEIDTSMYSFNVKKNDLFVLVSDGGDVEGIQKELLKFQKKNFNKQLNELYDYMKSSKCEDDISIVAILVAEGFTFA